jgi:alanine-glyoxylate transaminase/(R)-3-amino-2-methylpropionate-pyruvate transaminase
MKQPTLPASQHQPKPYTGPSADEVFALRKQYLSPALFHLYKKPIMIVEGKGQYVWDEKGRRYLDGFAGIATVSVGHCHPHIIESVRKQNETLQHSTTVYLHPNIAEFGQALAAKMPGDLKVCYFVNSGSEANDLAMLMARAYTGNYELIALRNAYHGGNMSAMGLTAHSTWKFNVPHSFGVHHAINADPYRGQFGRTDPEAGKKYAADIKSVIDYTTSGQIGGFIVESIQGVGGSIVFPDGYLKHAYEITRAAGGLCIADEVQTGFCRTGHNFWGFQLQGVTPDIVTMAKGIGNGAPLAAVVTTPQIASVLAKRIHFNTFGGNPVACAQGKAVLEVLEKENLQANALKVGNHLLAGLEKLKAKHELIGDVRGRGLMIGVELVKNRNTKEPAKAECAEILELAREMGLLIGKGGLWGQTIRIKPPLCITIADADFIIEVLDEAFAKQSAQAMPKSQPALATA